MKKLYAWLMKLTFGIDLKCDVCGRLFKTERGKNIHRASHKLYHYDPLEGQDTELWLRKNKLNEYKQSR